MRTSAVWGRMMALCYVTNGLAAFSLRIAAQSHPALTARFQYSVLYYIAGLAVCLAWAARRGIPDKQELAIGGAMAALSLCGQVLLFSALSHGVKGHIAFPVSSGGGLMIVTAATLILFRERISVYGVCGILCGGSAIALLTLAK